jgi:hypothetical protein
MGEGPRPVRAIGPPDMDLVAVKPAPGGSVHRVHLRQPLFRRHHRVHVQQAQPLGLARRPLDPSGSATDPAEHLVPAANAQHMAAAPDMGRQVDVPALRPQEGQVPPRRFRPRQDHQVGIAGNARAPAPAWSAARPAPASAGRDRRNSRCATARGRRCANPVAAPAHRGPAHPPPAAATPPRTTAARRSPASRSAPRSAHSRRRTASGRRGTG